MTLVRHESTRAIVEDVYLKRAPENLVLISYHIHPEQRRLINELSAATGTSKAAVVRELIDEWCESILRGQ